MADKPKILAVDDESDVLLIIQTALGDIYDVRTAPDGPKALAAVAADLPDLVILDVMMPGMDGFEVHAKLKDIPGAAAVPVIFLTGLSDRESKRAALDQGAPVYMVKPFSCADLMEKVDLLLKEGDATAP